MVDGWPGYGRQNRQRRVGGAGDLQEMPTSRMAHRGHCSRAFAGVVACDAAAARVTVRPETVLADLNAMLR